MTLKFSLGKWMNVLKDRGKGDFKLDKFRKINRSRGVEILKKMDSPDREKLRDYFLKLGTDRKSVNEISKNILKEHGYKMKKKFLKAVQQRQMEEKKLSASEISDIASKEYRYKMKKKFLKAVQHKKGEEDKLSAYDDSRRARKKIVPYYRRALDKSSDRIRKKRLITIREKFDQAGRFSSSKGDLNNSNNEPIDKFGIKRKPTGLVGNQRESNNISVGQSLESSNRKNGKPLGF